MQLRSTVDAGGGGIKSSEIRPLKYRAGRHVFTRPSFANQVNRIVGTGDEAPDQLVANPANWRTHPGSQRDALRGSLSTVGWVQQVMVDRRTGHVVDGHARVEEALTRHETSVPVLYVDLDPEEEALVLATLDPIGAMATRDDDKLRALLADITVDDAGLAALLSDLAGVKTGRTDPDEVPEPPEEPYVRAGTKGRRQALICEITNSGYDRHSVCWQHHDYSIKVATGAIENDAWFGYVCALDEGDDWTDEAVWPKANPLLDVSITRKYLREQTAEAQGIPAKQDIVKRLSFCVWTEGAARWLPLEGWDAMADGRLIPPGTAAFAGLGLASTTDLTAFTLVCPAGPVRPGGPRRALHRPARPLLGTRGGGAPPRRPGHGAPPPVGKGGLDHPHARGHHRLSGGPGEHP